MTITDTDRTAPSPELARWVGDAETFLACFWRRQPGVFHPAAPLVPPLTLGSVDTMLQEGLLRTPYLEMTRPDRMIPEDDYCTSRTVNQTAHNGFADATKVRELLSEGATLLLRCVDQWHSATAELADRFGRELSRKTEAFFFVTPPGRQGLRVHRDDADVFVLQVNGSKDWQIHPGTADGNWHPGPVSDPGPVLLTTPLQTGEVLYIPRGFAHCATGSRGLSAHLSFTVREIGGSHLHKELLRLISARHRPLPRPLDDADLIDQARVLIGRLTGELQQTTAEGLVASARDSLRKESAAHPDPGLMTMARHLAAKES
ncbi:JmjC domain-containing protein [Streptomyces sp. NPDC055966]|uniref:JmjC domain-containing protein n=1 Tax=Streptomyces sp. NPDC055966 TaxID=3345669 RepID=UPI0035D66FD0